MNRLVREHYPVDKLPEDLREGLQGVAEVRVTIEGNAEPAGVPSSAASEARDSQPGLFSKYRHLAQPRFASAEAVDKHVDTLRREWDQSGT